MLLSCLLLAITCQHTQLTCVQICRTLLQLETPFKDFTLEEVIFFLRFVYHTIDATAANFKLASAHAPGIIRLAHSLNVAGPLMAAADKFIGRKMTSIEAALKWLPLTETCDLHHAWSLGIRCVQGSWQ
jgi:hypothetical protein